MYYNILTSSMDYKLNNLGIPTVIIIPTSWVCCEDWVVHAKYLEEHQHITNTQ